MECAFTEAHYREILARLLAAGYRFCSYAGLVPGGRYQVILRHDVDLSLGEALRIARVDAELGVASTFHLLLTAEVYNLMSAAGQAFLQEVGRLGHRVGLHVDPMAIEQGQAEDASFGVGLARLFQLAGQVLGSADSYSIHRPAASGKTDALRPDRVPFPVPPYAYAAEYCEAIPYRSDSRRQWRHGCLCGWPVEEGQSLQLALHPIWWPVESCTRDEVLERYRDRQQGLVDDYLEGNLSFYRRQDAMRPTRGV